MLDSILAIAVVVLVFIEITLKRKIHTYIADKENIKVFEFYVNIILQLLVEAGVILIYFIRSYLPEATVPSCILLLIIILLMSHNLYKNYCVYSQIRNMLKKCKK